MKKFLSLGAIFLSLGIAQDLIAQTPNPPLPGGNIGDELATGRFNVHTPTNLAGVRNISMATWGNQGVPAVTNVEVVKGIDSLAANPLTNASAIAGKVCLLYRGGGINFSQKAQYAQNAGAVAVIIVNNVPGDPIAMGNTGGGTLNIPIIMLSDVDGNALNAEINAGNTVRVSIGKWNIAGANDLAILKGYASAPHALNIPLAQWNTSNNKDPYKNWVGGAVINYGDSTQTNVVVKDSVVFHPDGGTPSTVKQNSYTIPSIAPIDSILFGFGSASSAYWLTPDGKGRYDYHSKIEYNKADGAPQDNQHVFSQYINDSIFCKGPFDYTLGEPIANQGIRPGNASGPWSHGPMFYVNEGNYAFRSVQFYVSKNDAENLDQNVATVMLFKWFDTNEDNLMTTDELTMVGFNKKNFTANDLVGEFYNVPLMDYFDQNKTPVSEANSWYLVAVQLDDDNFLGVSNVSYFTRSYITSQMTNKVEFPEGITIYDLESDFNATGGSPVMSFAYGGNMLNIDSTFFPRYDKIPAVALHMSKEKINGILKSEVKNIGTVELFPSPVQAGQNVTVELNLNSTARSVNARVVNSFGQFISEEKFTNVQNKKYTISTQNLAAGTYHLMVSSEEGSTLKSFVVK